MASQVKPDPDAPSIKPDPDAKGTPLSGISDEDFYEDAGDLDFTNAAQSVWLSRIPRSLWEHWSHIDDDEEIELGTIRIEGQPNDIKRISMRLHERPDNKDVPKDYTLQRQTVTAPNASHITKNTYVFTEKDLPGSENRMVMLGEARSSLYESMKRDAKKRDRKKRWEPYIRKTIPKQTSIAGNVSEEFNCLPVENEEFRRISEKRALEALKPKKETVFIDKLPGKFQTHALPGTQGAFVQSTTKPGKVRAQENKTTRMPQNELLDLIYQSFREYKYWPFKALKARLQQPEAYLKQTLEMVAHLVKSGDFAMTWELKPEAMESNYANALYQDAREELPPEDYNVDASEGEGFPSGDEMQFENVV